MPPQLSDSNRRIIDSNVPSLRVYQVWKGSNRFFLGGRLIFGPDARSLLLTVFLIVVPVILFSTFVSDRLDNDFPHHLGDFIATIAIGFTIYIILLLLLTSGRDPGIIPRNPHPPEPEEDLSVDWAGGNQAGVPCLPPTKDVLVNGTVVKVKYCQTCMLYRPPRCSHCSICNNCVERFDHHCPWVGQCIGKRNYRFFFMFISSTTMLCLYVFAFCWVNVHKVMNTYDCNLWRAFMKAPVSGILILYTFISAWFVGGLTMFHLYLIFTNQTTYENFRYRYSRRTNPYNHGCSGNIWETFFSTIPKSKNKLREKVQNGLGSASAFENLLPLGRGVSPEMLKISLDIEMGKRQAVAAEDFEDLHGHIESVVGGVERSSRCANREMTPDVQMLVPEPHGKVKC